MHLRFAGFQKIFTENSQQSVVQDELRNMSAAKRDNWEERQTFRKIYNAQTEEERARIWNEFKSQKEASPN